MIPDWAHAITLADLVIGAGFIAVVTTGLWKAVSVLRVALDRIEGKTDKAKESADEAKESAEKAVANTQPNGGSSPYDATQATLARLEGRVDCMGDQISALTEHLGANHPGSVDPETGRPVMLPPEPEA